MRIDVNAFIGHYPFRRVSGGAPDALLEAMDRTGIDEAWISNLPALFWRDPTDGNEEVYRVARDETRFRPVPTVHPELANWADVMRQAATLDAPCVRVAPGPGGFDATGGSALEVARFGGDHDIPILMAVRLEDMRQRHPNDMSADLTPAAVRALIRSHPDLRLIVTHADREFIEQVHFGATPDEAARLLWDICWIWGPPEDHLELLVKTVGIERFTFGTGMPLRIPENSVAKLDLLELDDQRRRAVESGNLEKFLEY